MRVLATCHRGYIGTVPVPMLIDAKHDVVGLDGDLSGRSNFLDEIVKIPDIVKDPRDVNLGDVEVLDAVVHLAALSNDALGNINPDLTFDINHKASFRLAKLAKQGVATRYLFSSSCSTYGAAGDDFPAVLDAPRQAVHNLAFNVCRNEENYRIRRLPDFVTDFVADCRIEYAQYAGPDLRCHRVDSSKICKAPPDFELDWTMSWGVEEVHRAVHRQEVTTEEFEGARRGRLAHVKKLHYDGMLDAEVPSRAEQPVALAAG